MTKPVPEIIEDFYDAAWDLAGNLIYLRNKAVQGHDVPLMNFETITSRFREKADPFLNLTGSDIPQDLHQPFSDIEDLLNETVFPELTKLDKEWIKLYPPSPDHVIESKHQNKKSALQAINKGCADLTNFIEMEIIIRASTMRP